MSVSSSAVHETITTIVKDVFANLKYMFQPIQESAALQTAVTGSSISSIWREVHWILLIVTEVLIMIGFLRIFFKNYHFVRGEYFHIKKDYVTESCVGIGLIILSLILSSFAIKYNMPRIYHVTLFFLAPLAIIGILQITQIFNHFNISKKRVFNLIVIIVLIPYFLFNTGIIYELTGDTPSSVSLSLDKMKMDTNPVISNQYCKIIDDFHVTSSVWLYEHNENYTIYADYNRARHVLVSYGHTFPDQIKLISQKSIDEKGYIYLTEQNFMQNSIPYPHPKIGNRVEFLNYSEIENRLDQKGKIFSNGKTQILWI